MRTRIFKIKEMQMQGNVVLDVVLVAVLVVFLILPLFSAVVEKYIVESKIQIIRDALDITNVSAYNALNASSLGMGNVSVDSEALDQIYKKLLAVNLNLNEDLTPKVNSIVEGRVVVESLMIRTSGFPYTCPDDMVLTRPGVHSRIVVPIRPSLYRRIILDLLGREFVELHIHVDTELPVNN